MSFVYIISESQIEQEGEQQSFQSPCNDNCFEQLDAVLDSGDKYFSTPSINEIQEDLNSSTTTCSEDEMIEEVRPRRFSNQNTNFLNRKEDGQTKGSQQEPNLVENELRKRRMSKKLIQENLIKRKSIQQEGLLPKSKKEYTIVLDLDNTLIHTKSYDDQKMGMVYFRPYMHEFISQLSKQAEIVIFTASTQEYAECIVRKIDPERKYISHILSRNHITTYQEGGYTKFYKDLSIMGRNLNKTLLIDDRRSNFEKQPINGIWIQPWSVDMPNPTADIELLRLLKFLCFFMEMQMDIQTLMEEQLQQQQQQQQQQKPQQQKTLV